MSRRRDRLSNNGLLPLMEARKWKSGEKITYRYHPLGGKPIRLGTDREAAIRKVLDLNGVSIDSDVGTVNQMWRLYQDSADWKALSQGSRDDYTQSSKKLLPVFGKMRAASVRPAHINRYLRVHRKAAPVRANREAALLSNLMKVAVNRGDMDVNPCKQVSRNTERPRTVAPDVAELQLFLGWAEGQKVTLAAMAEFAALSGSRRMEFLRLQWPQVGDHEVRTFRGKQRGEVEIVDVIQISPALRALLDRLRARAADARIGPVFPTTKHNAPYTDSGFKSMWSKLVAKALKAGIITRRFTFHDLRAFYASRHKKVKGTLPDLHKNPGTTAKIYDRNTEVGRDAL